MNQPLKNVKLREVVELNPRRFAFPVADDVLVSFVPMKNVEEETGKMSPHETKAWGHVKKGYTPFQNGDVVFAKITPCMENGKYALAKDLHNGRAAGSTEFHVFRPSPKLDGRYLLHFLFSSEVRKAARLNMRGAAGQLRVPVQFFESLEIPLPPLPEQCRIVAEIEKQFSRLDEGVAALKRAQANLKRYRAAVLKAACEGKLVENEVKRKKEKGKSLETGEQLLKRILAERRQKWTGRGKYKEPAEPDTSKLPQLPEGWAWATVGACFQVCVGATPSRKDPSFWGGDIPWVSSGEVCFKPITQTRETITNAGLANSSTQMNPKGSVLLGMIGEGKTRGQTAILTIDACNNQNCAAIWVSQTPISPKYVFFWFWSQYDNTRRTSSGNNQPALNKARVESMPITLPPLAEQKRIVAEVERRLSVIDELEGVVASNLHRADRLRQAVLQKAFKGELV